MKIKIMNMGCLMNEHENRKLIEYLTINNFEVCEDDYDTLIISSCAVTKENENLVKKVISDNRNYKIFIVGCFSEKLKQDFINDDIIFLKKYSDLESYFAPNKIKYSEIKYNGDYVPYSIPNYLEDHYKSYLTACNYFSRFHKKTAEMIAHGLIGFEYRYNDDIYKVKISYSCTHNCSYCIIPKIKGTYKSRDIETVLKDIGEGYQKGFKKFLLIGDDLSSYGIELYKKYMLGSLLQAITKEFPEIKIGLRYLEPMTLPFIWVDIKPFIEKDYIFALNIPIQSGSIRVLKEINRYQNFEKFVKILKDLHEIYYGTLLTHVMVGFPFETIEDINETINLLSYFDNTSIHIFSPRESTKFANYPIHKDTKQHEMKVINYRRNMIATYLKKVLKNSYFFNDKMRINEREYRFLVDKTVTELQFNELSWSNEFEVDDLVYMNKEVDGFVIRFRQKNAKWMLQIKIKEEENEWKKISIPFEKTDLDALIMFVNEFMDCMGVVSKVRKYAVYNATTKIYLDEVKHLGTFIEIEGQTKEVDKLVKEFGYDISNCNPPYGKMLDKLNLNYDEEVLNLIKKQ